VTVTGEPEMVFDWSTDACEPENIPDIAANAYRDADGNAQLTIGHYVTYRMIGPELDDVTIDCSAPQLRSSYDDDPSQFNDSEWIGSTYTPDGRTVYAIVHNEYRGDTHGSARPDQCPSGQRLPCLDTSFTLAVSEDGGTTFNDAAAAPDHLIATLPYEYRDDTVPSGIRQPSNIIEGPDGFFYLFGNVSDQPDEKQWICAMRTEDLADPSSWRYWDGSAFTGVWSNPYLTDTSESDKCAPLAEDQLSGSLNEGIVYDEKMEKFIMIGVSFHPFFSSPRWGVYYTTSTDLVNWSTRELLIELPVGSSVADEETEVIYAYPSLLDPSSSSLNFDRSDGALYLYMSRFNAGSSSLDRDLLRWPIEVREREDVGSVEWNFDTDGDTEGWQVDSGLTELVVADGTLTTTSTGDDPYFSTGDIRLPAQPGTMTIRMRTTAPLVRSGQIFWVTEESPEYGEDKTAGFRVRSGEEFRDITIDLSENPGWTGTVRGLRIDPVDLADLGIEIDRVSFSPN
jgi:hypothetical protein